MRFLISRPDNVMSIDNVAISMDCSSLSSSINYVIWNESGTGFVEPSTGVALRTSFTDPAPYQTLVNAWIAAQAVATPALTLAQAQAIKNQLIAAIFGVKRQAPVTVHVTAGTYTWDASDMALTRMTALVGNLYIDPVNAQITTLDTNISRTNTFENDLQTNLNSWVASLNSLEGGVVGGWQTVGNVSVPAVALDAISALSVPTIYLVPYGGTTLVSLSPTDLAAIVAAIATQNATKQLANNVKQAAVNALTSIADVTAYDVTTGW